MRISARLLALLLSALMVLFTVTGCGQKTVVEVSDYDYDSEYEADDEYEDDEADDDEDEDEGKEDGKKDTDKSSSKKKKSSTSSKKKNSSSKKSNTSSEEERVNYVDLVYPVDFKVNLMTSLQSDYLSAKLEDVFDYASGDAEKSRPEGVKFQFATDQSATAKVLISENKDMSNAVTYTTNTFDVTVFNLKIGTQYYWQVVCGPVKSAVAKFSTNATAPRFIYADGVTNMRDIGGRKTESGKYVKQGMFFRNGCLDYSTDAGKKVIKEDLGIKTEIDLRLQKDIKNFTGKSFVDDSIKYHNLPMEYSGDMIKKNIPEIKKCFSILANENNYPISLHCAIGTDRTGMISFFLQALLGVPLEDISRDYMFSNFGKINGQRSYEDFIAKSYYKDTMAAKGSTLSEKTYNLLKSIGVPATDLDKIRTILLEK